MKNLIRLMSLTVLLYALCESGNAQWQHIGLSGYIPAVQAVGGELYAVTVDNVVRSTNGGISWDTLNPPALFNITYLEVIDSVLLVGAEFGCVDSCPEIPAIARSTDQGQSWTTVLSSGMGVYRILAHGEDVYSSLELFGFLAKSIDQGITWNYVSIDSALDGNVIPLGSWGDTFYVAHKNQILFSADGGVHWDLLSNGWGVADVNFLERQDSLLFVGTSDGIYRSATSGVSWEKVGPVSDHVMGMTLINGFIIAAFMRYPADSIYASPVQTNNWLNISSGLAIPWWAEMSFATDSTSLFVGTGNGVWRRALSEITEVEVPTPLVPTATKLNQNYPNPFNPETKISYFLARQGFISLKIYDILGRELITLIQSQQQAGEYSVSWNAGVLPSGLYFYRLVDGSYTKTKKMSLLR